MSDDNVLAPAYLNVDGEPVQRTLREMTASEALRR